ncbi:hypothetical protein [Streptacidiphilus fuscans]|uniref:hypothetical protein n=1 Tax=Streptacidiphilus fuscans TaxID=2789292 RepID=UPI001F3F7C0B|nr:hypothetical protein [Streptacidiphilus fuscans]
MLAVIKLAAVLVLGAGALLPAAASPGHAATTAKTTSSGSSTGQTSAPVLLDCTGKPQSQPSEYVLACGDGNNYLTSAHWTRWDGVSAYATATDVANDCQPYCAAGHFHNFPVDVTLTDPVPWQGHAGQTRYTKVTLFYPGARPAHSAQTVTLPLSAGPAIPSAT